MKKTINPKAIEIQRRFFEALDIMIASGQINGLKTFFHDPRIQPHQVFTHQKCTWYAHRNYDIQDD